MELESKNNEWKQRYDEKIKNLENSLDQIEKAKQKLEEMNIQLQTESEIEKTELERKKDTEIQKLGQKHENEIKKIKDLLNESKKEQMELESKNNDLKQRYDEKM